MNALDFTVSLNTAASRLSNLELVESSVSTNTDLAEALYTDINTIDAAIWMAKCICIGKLVGAATKKGLSLDTAIKDISSLVATSKHEVRKFSAIYAQVFTLKFVDSFEFPLKDVGYYELAVKYSSQLQRTPMDLINYMEGRLFELGKYSVAQAKMDLGILKPQTQEEKLVKHIIGVADADQAGMANAKTELVSNHPGKVEQAVDVLQGLLLNESPEEAQI